MKDIIKKYLREHENNQNKIVKKVIKEQTVDITSFQDEVFDLPLEKRQAVLRGLKTLLVNKGNEESLEEQINYRGIPELKATTTLGKIFKWFKRYITDKATNFLINASMSEIKDTIQMLDYMN